MKKIRIVIKIEYYFNYVRNKRIFGVLKVLVDDIVVDWIEVVKSGFGMLFIFVDVLFSLFSDICCLGWICREDGSCCFCCELVGLIICNMILL